MERRIGGTTIKGRRHAQCEPANRKTPPRLEDRMNMASRKHESGIGRKAGQAASAALASNSAAASSGPASASDSDSVAPAAQAPGATAAQSDAPSEKRRRRKPFVF
jgi:hypothetical protein